MKSIYYVLLIISAMTSCTKEDLSENDPIFSVLSEVAEEMTSVAHEESAVLTQPEQVIVEKIKEIKKIAYCEKLELYVLHLRNGKKQILPRKPIPVRLGVPLPIFDLEFDCEEILDGIF